MNKQEAIEKVKTMTVETFFSGTLFVKQQEVIAIIEQIGEPTSGCAEEAPRYLRNILARLRELPEHDRKVWLKAIMSEFEQDFNHAIWREGYEQGKFDEAVEVEKSNKVVIPQFVAEWIEVCKEHLTTSLYTAMNSNFMKENSQSFDLILWIKKTSNQDIFARAWLDGYEVKEEKLYTARLKINGKERDSYINRVIESGEIYLSNLTSIEGKLQVHFTQTELKELHYWNNPAFEIEEVSNE